MYQTIPIDLRHLKTNSLKGLSCKAKNLYFYINHLQLEKLILFSKLAQLFLDVI